MKKQIMGRSVAALIGAFVLAFVHQYLFYGNLPGVSYPLFVLLLYIYLFHDIRHQLLEIPWFGWFLFTVIMLLSMTYVIFNNPFFYGLNLVVIPSLVFVHLAYTRGRKKHVWWSIRIVGEAINHLIPQSLRHIPTVFRIIKVTAIRKMGIKQKSVMGKVLIGLAIALPLIVVVINLLASADGVFTRLLEAIPESLNSVSLGDSLMRFIWIIVFGVLFFGYLWGFVKPSYGKSKQVMTIEKDKVGKETAGFRIDPIILVTLLISVNIVYVLFVVVQFSYLFGAWDGVLPEGKSYAEYARSGFVELVVVSLINFVILMVTLFYEGESETGRLRRMNAVLLYILVGCSGVMLYSAYMRLVLYEEAYGYTYIRFLVHAFMIYLVILLIIAALRIRSRNIPLTKWYIFISLVAYVFMNYLGMDRVIAEKNIDRFRESGIIDAGYLSELSTDTIPLLIRFSKEEYPEMKPYLKRRFDKLVENDYRWPSFNGSRYRAIKELYPYVEAPSLK
ncbi:DUF4153 domain-containing protein [Cohnella abietis]|nr:DUF4173 domain-containing protein [Cohnella abietis]